MANDSVLLPTDDEKAGVDKSAATRQPSNHSYVDHVPAPLPVQGTFYKPEGEAATDVLGKARVQAQLPADQVALGENVFSALKKRVDPVGLAALSDGKTSGQPVEAGVAMASTPPAPPAPCAMPAAETPDTGRKVIRHGEMLFEVDSFDSAFMQITKIAAEEGGFVADMDWEKLANGKVAGTVTVRVPPDHLDTLTLKLRGLGDLKGQKIASDDITKEYTDLQSELSGRHGDGEPIAGDHQDGQRQREGPGGGGATGGRSGGKRWRRSRVRSIIITTWFRFRRCGSR